MVNEGVLVVFAMVDVICGVVTEGACAAESVHPAKNAVVMIRKIVIIPIQKTFTVPHPGTNPGAV
jgi:hypothetical protein